MPTDIMVAATWENGKWGPVRHCREPYFKMHALSNIMHYGQGIFEGLKAHHCKDGKVRIFNSEANAERFIRGARRLNMPEVPSVMFTHMVDEAVRANIKYLPPYGYGGSLYVRPFLFGRGAQLGLGSAPKFTCAVIVTPVGSYYKSGLEAVDALVIDTYDRASKRGVGHIKAAGNYAADVKPAETAYKKGYPIALYLDSAEQKYVEEFSTSNFVAISQDGSYVTPISFSILESTTNQVFMQLAQQEMGMNVEHRPISIEECATLKEVAACGTAVVLTPVKSITYHDRTFNYEPINRLRTLYELIRGIQVGDVHDKYGLTREIEYEGWEMPTTVEDWEDPQGD